MNNIHMILTVKGGVGKSFIAAILAQYFGKDTYLADTDPGNATFSSYKKLGVKHIDILSENMNIDKRRFDELIDTILEFDGEPTCFGILGGGGGATTSSSSTPTVQPPPAVIIPTVTPADIQTTVPALTYAPSSQEHSFVIPAFPYQVIRIASGISKEFN